MLPFNHSFLAVPLCAIIREKSLHISYSDGRDGSTGA